MNIRRMLDERPWYQLTSHFFRGLFDLAVLSDEASDAVRRVLIGSVAVTLTFGLLLARMYLAKYAALSEMTFNWGAGYQLTREPYHLAVLGDGALVIAFPMMVVGFVVVVIGNSLFPDLMDCRVLLPLPVSRRLVFGCKALAIMLFAGVFALAAQIAMLPVVVLMSNNRWAGRGTLAWMAAYGLASLAASITTALVITAIAGALLICVPRSRLQAGSVAFRAAALCALVFSIPLMARLPAMGALIAGESRVFYLAPPAWFLGVAQLLLGNVTPYFMRLAQIAAAVAVVSLGVALGSYMFLYHRFERVIFRPVQRPAFTWRRRRAAASSTAIAPFIRATLMRSPLHQLVFVALSACGVGLVLNAFVGEPAARMPSTAIWAPFALVFAMNAGLRASLRLPLELRANWIFRLTEDERTRSKELNAVVRVVIVLGVVAPLVMLFPLEWAVLGRRAIECTSIAFLCGLVLVELHMSEWRRIPFTCSYAPSRRFVGLTMFIIVVAFALFTTIGSGLVSYSIGHRRGWFAVMAILGAVFVYLRRQRLWLLRRAALTFEDVLPNEIEPLRLSEY